MYPMVTHAFNFVGKGVIGIIMAVDAIRRTDASGPDETLGRCRPAMPPSPTRRGRAAERRQIAAAQGIRQTARIMSDLAGWPRRVGGRLDRRYELARPGASRSCWT